MYTANSSRRVGWMAHTDPAPRHQNWSPEWTESNPIMSQIRDFFSHGGMALRRKLSFWDTQISSSDRTRLTRSSSVSRTSSISVTPSQSTLRFVALCSLWYASSAMSSNTGKQIMNQFKYPVTLTFVQFAFVSLYCALFMSPAIGFSKMRRPSWAIMQATLPMGAFQVGGHIFSSMAISRIPVSTVHTIKALSPLFTVAAYALLFNVSYSAKTYLSLLPLTIGVMLVCTFDVSGSNWIGLLCAFGSALVFVSSNIFFKKVMPSGSTQNSSHKLDKLNLLLYSSGTAFVLMIPIWLYCDLPVLMSADVAPRTVAGKEPLHSVMYYFFLNGTVHFAQNIIAFIILASTSPVTYSIASLIKRVAVICIAIVWFAQSVHPVQAIGIAMTFGGLYMYNQAKGDVEKGENKMRRVEAARDMRLPTTMASTDNLALVIPQADEKQTLSVTSGYELSAVSPTVQRGFFVGGEPPFGERERRDTISGGLHIKIHPPSLPVSPQAMALGSYPSPPSSVDSPPMSAVPLVSQNSIIGNSIISKRMGEVSRQEPVQVGVVA